MALAETPTKYSSPLHQMSQTTPTAFWNDSCSPHELAYAIEHGAVGATSNPVIVATVLRNEMSKWEGRIRAIIKEIPTCTEDDVAWKVCEEMSVKSAQLLLPAFAQRGNDGRLAIQTDPRFYRDAQRMVDQAVLFDGLTPNITVKIPATEAGIEAIEEATFRGISVTATVSFTVSQAVAVAEAVERGLTRREAEGKEVVGMGPICTIMVGRVDDWLKVVMERDDVITTPGIVEWAGVAVMKTAYRIYRERGYRLRLLAAAYRNHLHWSEFIGGDVVVSIPHLWQKRFNASGVEVRDRMDTPVSPTIVDELSQKLPDFRRAHEPDGLSVEEFATFGPAVSTLRQFLSGYHTLVGMVRDLMLPDVS